jgi:hypothetical protein
MKIILIIILIIVIIFLFKKNENYTIIQNEKKTKSAILPRTGIRQGSDPLESNLFNDVIMYIGDRTLDGELGLEKCIKVCDGMCVEYGMTGDAFCFPSNYEETKQKYIETLQSELKNQSLI